MRNKTRQTRENRTITVDFQNEATYLQLLGNGKAFVECVLAFLPVQSKYSNAPVYQRLQPTYGSLFRSSSSPQSPILNASMKGKGTGSFNSREYCLGNDILICFPIMLLVTKAIGEEAWTPVRNARIYTSLRPGRPGAISAGSVGAVAINSRAPRHVGDPCGRSRWPCSSIVTVSP